MEMARPRSITTGWLIGRKRQFRSRSLRTIIVSLGAGTESQKGKTDRAEGPGPSRAAGQRSRRSEPAADKAAQAVHRERPIADFGRLDRASFFSASMRDRAQSNSYRSSGCGARQVISAAGARSLLPRSSWRRPSSLPIRESQQLPKHRRLGGNERPEGPHSRFAPDLGTRKEPDERA